MLRFQLTKAMKILQLKVLQLARKIKTSWVVYETRVKPWCKAVMQENSECSKAMNSKESIRVDTSSSLILSTKQSNVYHCVEGQRVCVCVDRESTQMVPLCMWTERALKWYHCVCGQRQHSNDTTVYVDRESTQMVPLCMWTRALKWYHDVISPQFPKEPPSLE